MVDRTGLHTAPVPGNPPLGTAPVDGRLVQGALFGTGAQCLAGGGYTASATSMAFAIAAGVYQIPDTANAGAVYHSPVDGVTLTPAAGQAGGRIDSIYVLQQDYEKNGTTSRVVYGLAAGTAGSGTAPSLSGIAGGPMRLMNITVPANATKATDCTVSWVVPPATLALDGPILPTKTLLDLVPGTYPGQRAYVGQLEYRWDGAAWKLMPGPTLMAHLRLLAATDFVLADNQNTDVQFDTAVYDPQGLKTAQGNQSTFTIPFAGRWLLSARVAFTATDSGNVYTLGFSNVTSGSSMSSRGQIGVANATPIEHTTEEVLAQGTVVKAFVYKGGTNANYILRGSAAASVAPQFIARYLGPA